MLRKKYAMSLSSGANRKKHIIGMGIACGALALGIIVAGVMHAKPDDRLVNAPTLDLNALGAKEWLDHSELNRQSFQDESDSVSSKKIVENENIDPFHIKGKIKRNQTLFSALKSHQLNPDDIQQVIASLDGVIDFKKTHPGDQYEVHLDDDRRILQFVYIISPEDISVAKREGNAFLGKKMAIDREEKRIHLAGSLSGSLYQSIEALGESGELASHFMRLFKYDIDFASDSQPGDEFSVLVDKITLNGKFYRYGRVWAATYRSNAGKFNLEAYYFDDKDDLYDGYYDAHGHALKRTFLKVPVIGCSISSPYNLTRMHPILKRVRPHYGIDWACPTGTPIMAFADGTVSFADWKGGNGNLLVVEHAHGYTSLYAHIYRFAPGIKKGVKVKSGQVIATVGNTGISTGPHLHFGVKKNNKYIDPSKIDTRHALSLTGSKLTSFLHERDELRKAFLYIDAQSDEN